MTEPERIESGSARYIVAEGPCHGLGNEVDSVTDPLDSVLVELEQFGKANDASTSERTRCMLNVTRDTGEFLAVLVRATLAGGCSRLARRSVPWVVHSMRRPRRAAAER